MKAPSLRVKRLLPAEVNRVFDAWKRADAMSRWFACDPGWTATATNDFRVGGKYRIEMRCGDDTLGVASGEYLEVDPPHRLVFTWSSEGRVNVTNSVVTVDLKESGALTELTLTHDLDPGTAVGRAHSGGWEGALTKLEGYLRREIMGKDDALAVVRAYYHGWTSKKFDEAIHLLAQDLTVEVPINQYPTTESFANALVGFGGMVKNVTLLAEFAKDYEAMLLYDMDVERLGTLRVAEHFTVGDGRITRIRQIHDTAAVRAAGFGPRP